MVRAWGLFQSIPACRHLDGAPRPTQAPLWKRKSSIEKLSSPNRNIWFAQTSSPPDSRYWLKIWRMWGIILPKGGLVLDHSGCILSTASPTTLNNPMIEVDWYGNKRLNTLVSKKMAAF
jgi:hypothetical protein